MAPTLRSGPRRHLGDGVGCRSCGEAGETVGAGYDPPRRKGGCLRADDVYLVSRKLVLPAPSALDSLEHRIGVLPPGYRQFMSTLGIGRYSGDLRVYAPEDVLAERA